MEFKGIENLDELIRTAEWNEMTAAFISSLRKADSFQETNTAQDTIVPMLQKEFDKYKRKKDKYYAKMKQIRSLMDRIQSGEISINEVQETIESEPIESITEDEEYSLKEVDPEAVGQFAEYNNLLRNRK